MLDFKTLEYGNWTIVEFFFECEKKAIVEQVAEYNLSIEFPQEMIDRANSFS